MNRTIATAFVAAGCIVATPAHAGDDFFEGVTVNGSVALHKDITLHACTLYGRTGVTAHKNVTLADGAKVGSESTASISGFDPDDMVSADVTALHGASIESMIVGIESGRELPGNIGAVTVVGSLPDVLVPGTAYVVNGDVSFDKGYAVSDVLIAARGDIRWGKDGTFTNSGSAGDYAIGLVATGSVTIQKDGELDGAMVVAGGDVTFDKDFFSASLAMQIGGDLMIKKETTISGLGGFKPLFAGYRSVGVPGPTSIHD